MGYTKLIRSGNQLEIYEFSRDISPKIASGFRKRFKQKDSEPVLPRYDSILRRSKGFSRLVSSNFVGEGVPCLLTLTCFEIVGIEVGYIYLRIFFKRIRESLGSSFKYIAVPEFQKRGAVHFHCLVWGWSNEIIQNERYSRFLQNIWSRGYVDCLLTDGSDKLVGYLSKYMRKAMSDKRLMGQKGYTASRNVLRPVFLKTSVQISYAKEIYGVSLEALSTVVPLHERFFDTQWLGKGRYRLYKQNNKT